SPELVGEAVAVQEVVDDLVEDAELRREAAPRLTLALRRSGDRERTADRGLEQPPGLERMPAGEIALAADVVELPADHAERCARQLTRHFRPRIGERELECLREQRVA